MATNQQPAAVPLHLDHSASNHRCQECRLNEQIRGLRDSINLQNHEKARLESENRRLGFALQVERCRRLTLLIDLAIRNGDQEQWARCVAERMGLGVAIEMASQGTAIDDIFSTVRGEVGE